MNSSLLAFCYKCAQAALTLYQGREPIRFKPGLNGLNLSTTFIPFIPFIPFIQSSSRLLVLMKHRVVGDSFLVVLHLCELPVAIFGHDGFFDLD